jgi:hypothetical protein
VQSKKYLQIPSRRLFSKYNDVVKIAATGEEEAGQARPETNKSGLAARYQVGIRTIENWLAWEIIPGRMERGEIVADVAECDRRLMEYKNSTP